MTTTRSRCQPRRRVQCINALLLLEVHQRINNYITEALLCASEFIPPGPERSSEGRLSHTQREKKRTPRKEGGLYLLVRFPYMRVAG